MKALVEEHEAAVGGTSSAASSADALRKAGRNPMALPPAALSQLAKSALSLEVGCWQLTDRICAALRASRWRQKAAAALKDGKKHSGASQFPVSVSLHSFERMPFDNDCSLYSLKITPIDTCSTLLSFKITPIDGCPYQVLTMASCVEYGDHEVIAPCS